MNKWQRDVMEFHKACNLPVGEKPDWPSPARLALRCSLHHEEERETYEAAIERNFPKFVDGLVDLLYVTIGSAVEAGVDLEELWDAVHEANMRKTTGPKRADGKQLKPDGWKPADVAGLIEDQKLRASGCCGAPVEWKIESSGRSTT